MERSAPVLWALVDVDLLIELAGRVTMSSLSMRLRSLLSAWVARVGDRVLALYMTVDLVQALAGRELPMDVFDQVVVTDMTQIPVLTAELRVMALTERDVQGAIVDVDVHLVNLLEMLSTVVDPEYYLQEQPKVVVVLSMAKWRREFELTEVGFLQGHNVLYLQVPPVLYVPPVVD